MKYSAILIIALKFSTCAIAREGGFYRANDKKIPDAVQIAAESAYQVAVQDTGFLVHNISTQSLNKVYFDHRKTQGYYRPFDEGVHVIYQRMAFRWGNAESTEQYEVNGSGFLFESKNQVVTAVHVLKSLFPPVDPNAGFDLKDWKENLESFSPRIFFLQYNDTGRLKAFNSPSGNTKVEMPYSGYHLITSTRSGKGKELRDGLTGVVADYDVLLHMAGRADFAILHTRTESDATPLKAATKRPVAGEILYLIGYPNEAKRENGQESNGDGLFVTFGKLARIHAEEDVSTGIPAELLVIDSDGWMGMSGGPVVNALGEVVGIITKGIKENKGSNSAEFAAALPIWEMERLKSEIDKQK